MTTDTADIRQYLTSAYSDEELTTLCSDYFRDVYDNFTVGMTKGQKIQLLLDHCQRRGLLPNLLAALERDRPDQYRVRFAPPVAEPGPAAAPRGRDPRQVFISHAHEDAEFAHRLAADLQARSWRVWIAPDSIRPGEMWVEAIGRGLEESGVCVLVLTPFAVRSDWVKTETRAAIGLVHKGKMRFIPAEVISCEVPPLWEAYQWIPFAGRYESGLIELLAVMRGAQPPPVAEAQCPSEPIAHNQTEQRLDKRNDAGAMAQPAFQQAVLKAVAIPASQAVSLPDFLIIESPVRIELVRVPAGEFLLGFDRKVKALASDDEQPQHRLTLPDFYIGKYPVTNEQYAAFVKATRQATPRHWKNGQIPTGKGGHPVVNVTWRDAVAFCRWLSQACAKSLRLPTEAEWEKAARGADGRIYPWGDELPTEKLCNFDRLLFGGTRPVWQCPAGASPCGAWDMAGNVWEWTGSLYRPYPYRAEDGRNWPDGEEPRVVRGGDWMNVHWRVGCTVRDKHMPHIFGSTIGFRVVLSLSS